jgi:hypothetical protein
VRADAFPPLGVRRESQLYFEETMSDAGVRVVEEWSNTNLVPRIARQCSAMSDAGPDRLPAIGTPEDAVNKGHNGDNAPNNAPAMAPL